MLLFASSLLNVLGELSRDVAGNKIKIQGPEGPRVDLDAVRARYELTALMVRKAEALRGARRRPASAPAAVAKPARIGGGKAPVTGAPLADPVDTQPLISADNRPQFQPPGEAPAALFGPPTAADIEALEDGPTLPMPGKRPASSSHPDGASRATPPESGTSAPGPSRAPRSGKKRRRPVRRKERATPRHLRRRALSA